MKTTLLTVLIASVIGCATPSSIVTTPVYSFGPDTYTTSASTAVEAPNRVREQVLTDASAFCEELHQRSLPIEINLVTAPSQPYSNVTVHSATMVFGCFDTASASDSEEGI